MGLGFAVAGGVIWSLILWIIPYLPLNLIIAPGLGAVIGELISRSVNRKRGIWLAIIAGGAVLLSYLVKMLSPWSQGFYVYDIIGLILGIITAAGAVR